MVAGVLIRCQPQQEAEVLDALRKLEGLAYVYRLFGRYDMVALIRSLDLHAASEVVGRIRAIEGVTSIEPLWCAQPREPGAIAAGILAQARIALMSRESVHRRLRGERLAAGSPV
jgi:DNA-binding Lrp family transcriptional regulator